jgi:UV excision repair protein RAD23
VTATPSVPAVSPFEDAETVTNLISMGFSEPEVRAALRAAYGNAERAVEYLMTGIPDSGAWLDCVPHRLCATVM